MSDLQTLQTQLHYSFKNAHLLEEALTAAGASVSRADVDGPASGNKRLALIGDAVLRLSVLDEWYPGGGSTGAWENRTQKYATDVAVATGHNMVVDVGTNEKLAELAKARHLTAWLIENPCQAGQEPKVTLASTVEAVIGAVWVDCDRNLAKVQQVIKQLQG